MIFQDHLIVQEDASFEEVEKDYDEVGEGDEEDYPHYDEFDEDGDLIDPDYIEGADSDDNDKIIHPKEEL